MDNTQQSAVPMMVYGFWCGIMEVKYQLQPKENTEDVFKQALARSTDFSEMRRIGAAIDAAAKTIECRSVRLDSGLDIVQDFTEAHLKSGIYNPVCFAWISDNTRQRVETVFQQQNEGNPDKSIAMLYALSAALPHTQNPFVMRDVSTVVNCVISQAQNSGISRDVICDAINSSLLNEQKWVLYQDESITNEEDNVLQYAHDVLQAIAEEHRLDFVHAVQEEIRNTQGEECAGTILKNAYMKFEEQYPQYSATLRPIVGDCIEAAEMDEDLGL